MIKCTVYIHYIRISRYFRIVYTTLRFNSISKDEPSYLRDFRGCAVDWDSRTPGFAI